MGELHALFSVYALGVAELDYQWGKRRPKLRSVDESLLQKSARESGEVTEIEILARIRQVNG